MVTITKVSLATLAAAALLTACSSDDGHDMGAMTTTTTTTAAPPATSSAATGHNAADVAFAQGMIPHHAQAVDMAELVDGRTTNPEVVDLAARVEAAQAPEIETMTGWLTAWGAEVPAADQHGDHGGHDSMPGMMSATDMESLTSAKNAEFDTLWLDMMIEHHEGAVVMAETELADGADAGAKQLAQQIVDAQRAEITEMRSLLEKS